MSGELDARGAPIFAAALALAGEARTAFVRGACAGDLLLEAEVLSLLRAHDGADDFLVPDTAAPAAAPPVFARERYRLVRELGRGGMAIVWLAEQKEPVERTVALKVMEYRLGGAESRRRFDVERQAIARMDHPGIAQVFDAGTTLDGRPFLAMEYVPGLAITAFCRERALSLAGRLRLLVAVCHAVHHAHMKGVVHRDLKPSNVLVVESDGRPLPKLIDFGIAKASATDGERTTVTAQGELLGTLEYMSPEQAAGGAAGVDAATDVYSLGAILYELVTGRLPLAIGDARVRGIAQALATIERDDPVEPSAMLKSQARAERDARRRRELFAQARAVQGDLDAVVMKALQKPTHRRYATARELADDLDRFLAHDPVAAVPSGRLDRLKKLVARHRAATIGIAGVFLSLIAGLVVAIVMLGQLRTQTRKVSDSEARTRDELERAIFFAGQLSEFAEMELANLAGGASARVHVAELAATEQEHLVAATTASATNSMRLSYAYQRRGEAYAAAGRSKDALASFTRSLEVRAAGARDFPDADTRRSLGVGHWRMSDGLTLVGDVARALEHDRAAAPIMEAIAASGGFDAVATAVYVGIAHRRIADDLEALGEAKGAFEDYVLAQREVEKGLVVSPTNGPLRECSILTLRGRAHAERNLDRHDAAIESLRGALDELALHMKQAGVIHVWSRLQRARTYGDLAPLLIATGRADEGIAAANTAVEIAAALVDDDPQDWNALQLLANARCARGRATTAAAAIRLAPAASELAATSALLSQKDLTEAVAALRELAVRDPDSASVARDLAAADAALAELARTAADSITPGKARRR